MTLTEIPEQTLVVVPPEPLKWSDLIFRHEMSTIAWARTKESDPQFKELHKAFLKTGLALDEYVQKLRNPK